MRQPITTVRTAAPLALRLHTVTDSVVPPATVWAAVEWEALGPCEVLDAHAYIEVHVRAALLNGPRPSILEESAVVTSHGDVVPRFPGDGAEALPLTGPLFPGAHGRLPCAIFVGTAHPSVHTPLLDLSHTLVARVLLVGHDPIEVRRPFNLLVGRDGHAALEHSPPGSQAHPRVLPPALEVPLRHARPGGTVAGTVWPGDGGPTTVTLRRVSFLHALGNPGAGPVSREDDVVATHTVEPGDGGTPFALTLPHDAEPTCVTRFGSVRWMARAETAPERRRWRRGHPAASGVTEVDLNVFTA